MPSDPVDPKGLAAEIERRVQALFMATAGDGDTPDSFQSEVAEFAQLVMDNRGTILDGLAALADPAPGRGEAMRERCARIAFGHADCLEGNPPTCGETVARGIGRDIRALPLASPNEEGGS